MIPSLSLVTLRTHGDGATLRAFHEVFAVMAVITVLAALAALRMRAGAAKPPG